MHTTPTVTEMECRAFLAAYPTHNTMRAVALAAAGILSWDDAHALFTRSLGTALSTVAGVR